MAYLYMVGVVTYCVGGTKWVSPFASECIGSRKHRGKVSNLCI